MYDYLRGTLVFRGEDTITLEVGGIGFRLFFPKSSLEMLPPLKSAIVVYVSFVVREFAHALYGFLTQEERGLFELLQNVNGIGPKLALQIVSHLPFEKLVQAICEKNIAHLVKVPGIGKKTAERILIDLEGKLIGTVNAAIPLSKDMFLEDAVSALVNLGYTKVKAEIAVKRAKEENPDLEDLGMLITSSLKQLS